MFILPIYLKSLNLYQEIKNIESVISSSGTSANALSKIHLNREN